MRKAGVIEWPIGVISILSPFLPEFLGDSTSVSRYRSVYTLDNLYTHTKGKWVYVPFSSIYSVPRTSKYGFRVMPQFPRPNLEKPPSFNPASP